MTPRDFSGVDHSERRDAPRDDVYYRTRTVCPRLGTVPVQIVDVSASGCMARTEDEFTAGDALTFKLPVIGEIRAEVRWALGGRIGCQFDRMIPLAPYLELLGALVKNAR